MVSVANPEGTFTERPTVLIERPRRIYGGAAAVSDEAVAELGRLIR